MSIKEALTSAWLEMPHAHKTFLELLLKFYNVSPFKDSSPNSDIDSGMLFKSFTKVFY